MSQVKPLSFCYFTCTDNWCDNQQRICIIYKCFIAKIWVFVIHEQPHHNLHTTRWHQTKAKKQGQKYEMLKRLLIVFLFPLMLITKTYLQKQKQFMEIEICHDANLSSLGTPQIVIQRASSAANDIKAYSQSSVLVLDPSFLLLFMKKTSYLFFRIGRRYPLAAFHLIAGIPLFILLGIPVTTSTYSQNISNHSLCNIYIFLV